jgi:hypothetical protein
MVWTDAPPTTEVTVTRQPGRSTVHLVNYQPNRRGAHIEVIEEMVPLRDVSVRLKLPKSPRRAIVTPGGVDLPISYSDGAASVVIPAVREHALVAFED